MANIPNGAYSVQLGNNTNNWANGALNTNQTPPTYKGNNCSTYNLDETNVSWTVSVTHAGGDCTLTFTGGVYAAATPPAKATITGGTVSSPCFADITATGDDTWSATAS
jgi:hypothetical protein